MLAVRITGLVCDFETEDVVPVFDVDEAPDGEHVIRSEADFAIHALAARLEYWKMGGFSEEEFRALLREHWPIYAEVVFPGRRTWLELEEAEALVELGVAEPVTMGEVDEALEAWGLR